MFDIDLARSRSREENPVYYIQMAHARMCGIFRVGEIDSGTHHRCRRRSWRAVRAGEAGAGEGAARLPGNRCAGAAEALEPHRVAAWLLETARAAHTWYHKHHVLGEPEDITRARLVLARATQLGLAAGLRMLGLTAPERM